MKEKRRDTTTKQAEWERLLKANIYMGDHLTRDWAKESRRHLQTGTQTNREHPDTAAEPSTAETAKRHSICPTNSQILLGKEELARQLSVKGVQPKKSELVKRKPSAKRKLKSAKEILAHHNITEAEFFQWQESFDSLLQSSTGRSVFKLFLESEVAEENLEFWLACEDLKTIGKQKHMEKRIQDIYETFINVYSPHEVNIDYKMREDIVDQLKFNMDSAVYTVAQNQIYTLMHRDSYPRFLSSQLNAELEKELSERKSAKPESGKKSKTENSTKTSHFSSCCSCLRLRRETDIVMEEKNFDKATNSNLAQSDLPVNLRESIHSRQEISELKESSTAKSDARSATDSVVKKEKTCQTTKSERKIDSNSLPPNELIENSLLSNEEDTKDCVSEEKSEGADLTEQCIAVE